MEAIDTSLIHALILAVEKGFIARGAIVKTPPELFAGRGDIGPVWCEKDDRLAGRNYVVVRPIAGPGEKRLYRHGRGNSWNLEPVEVTDELLMKDRIEDLEARVEALNRVVHDLAGERPSTQGKPGLDDGLESVVSQWNAAIDRCIGFVASRNAKLQEDGSGYIFEEPMRDLIAGLRGMKK